MMDKLKIKFPVTDYFFIALGAALMAIGIGVFLVEAKVVPGGASGLAMITYYVSGGKIPVGVAIWAINVPLFAWGYKELGKTFGLRTFFGFTLVSFFIDFFRGDIPFFGFIRLHELDAIKYLAENDFFFLILLGAVLLGVGLGVIFKFRGTTAGSDIVASVIHKRYGMKPGTAIMLIDFFVISLAGVVIQTQGLSPDIPALSLTLYAMLLLFVSSKLIDVIIDGFDYARAALIISDKFDEIGHAIMNDMSRGATAIKTRGLYRNIEREMIYTIITRKELGALTELIKKIDPTAFIIINNVHEVLGEGFRRRI
ncbi:MAG: YitT family protein [Candidatus Kapabacteria bacterium]|nr:YitT family protein [Ignavibacteriota bacterium]MCW5884795.1 YitT family protein [Candidatus Kapabacteria bacterium]